MITWSSSNFKEIFPDRVSEFTNSLVPNLFNDAFLRQYKSYGVDLSEEIQPLVSAFSYKLFLNISALEWIAEKIWRQSPEKLTQMVGGHALTTDEKTYADLKLRPPLMFVFRMLVASVAAVLRQNMAYKQGDSPSHIWQRGASCKIEDAVSILEHHLSDHLKVGVISGALHGMVCDLLGRLSVERDIDPLSLLNTPARAPNIMRQRAWEEIILAANQKTETSDIRGQAQLFLDEFGHRAVFEMEVSYPKPAEDIDAFLQKVSEQAERGVGVNGGVAEATEEFSVVARAYIKLLTKLSSFALTIRERSKSILASDAFRLRVALIEIAKRHSSAGLDDPHDIFFLRFSEVLDLENGLLPDARVLVQARKKKPEPAPPPDTFFETLEGTHKPPTQTLGADLSGTAVSGRHAEGRVRILRSYTDMNEIQQGDIVVVHALDSGWSDVFAYAGGVIAETGGTMSHAAILLRENGIPALFNVYDATIRLCDGDHVVLDTRKGKVYRDLDSKKEGKP